MHNVTQKVKQIMTDKLAIEEGQLLDEASFKDDLNVDSLDVLELQMELEKQFNLTIPDEEAEKLVTVGSVIRYVQAHAQ
ncbi:MAG: acyl carrier protein [Sphingobacteriia bacterium]|nr:acyl carrier protein [Sphingobacteriia bacterium]